MHTEVNISSVGPVKGRRAAKLSLTPLIDVVFILLIFFMLESDFLTPYAMDMSAPGGAQSSEKPSAPLMIELQANGTLWLNKKKVTIGEFRSLVAQMNPDPETPAVLSADEGVALQRAVDVLDVLQQRGMTNIALQEAQKFDAL